MTHKLHMNRTFTRTYSDRHGTADEGRENYKQRLTENGIQYNEPTPGVIEFIDLDGSQIQVTWENQ